MDLEVGSHINDYVIEMILGKGAFSQVYLASHTKLKTYVAIKRIRKEGFSSELFEREVRLHSQIDHPFAAAFYSAFADEQYFYIVMEYVSGGSLLSYIKKNGPMPEYKAKHIFSQLICFLHYLHKQLGTIHRDIKLENIMLDECGNIRIIDFGLGNTLSNDDNLLKTACGSLQYASPEMIAGEPYTINADTWAAGCVLYILTIGKMPFDDQNLKILMNKIISQDPYFPDTLSPELLDLLRHCLIKDRILRYSETQIPKHPWFSCGIDKDLFMSKDFVNHFDLSYKKPNDDQTLTKLEYLGFPREKVMESFQKNVCDKYTTAYYIMHRTLNNTKLKLNFSMPKEDPAQSGMISLIDHRQNSTSMMNITLNEMKAGRTNSLIKSQETTNVNSLAMTNGRLVRRKFVQMSQSGRKFGLVGPSSFLQKGPQIFKPTV